ncbi:MAG TPA: hypothetical protein VGD37_39115 [Kofleriaceae bacterium]
MTDRDDDLGEASGVPERTERTESGRHVTDSGRHITNRNVVPRAGTAGARDDDGELRGESAEDAFDVVTPVRPPPRDVFEEADVTLSHDDEGGHTGGGDAGPAPVSDPRLVLPPPRRPPTERGLIEPRRRPSLPPLPLPPAPDAPDASGVPGAPGAPTHDRSRRVTARVPRARRATPAVVGDRAAVPAWLDRALRGVTVLAVLGLGVVGFAQPDAVLRGGAAWLAFLVFVLAGWGVIVTRLARAGDCDFGLRAALGAAGYLAIAGVLVAAGLLTRSMILGLIGLGAAGFAWREATAPVATWHRVRDGLHFVRWRPALGAMIAAIVVLAGARLLGAASALDASPWDDDVAYTGFVQRLLDTGGLIEPFSFRRLGAYGGQTALGALAAARGTLANVHLIDRGLGLGVVLLAMVGHARERDTQPLWLALIALVLVLLPETAINTASYWTGVVMFLALYRSVVREHWAVAGMVAGATCTLRQNFLVPVVVFLAAVLIARLIGVSRALSLGDAWRQERRRWLVVAGVALAVIVPWCIAAQLSSDTFLFPIIDGTWNHGLSLKPAVTSWPEELAALVTACLEPSPIAVIPILALVVVFTSDRRLGRPLGALLLASALGFVALVHGFIDVEPLHLWRYAFGFATTLVVVLVLELGSDDEIVMLAPLGRWIVLAALVLQLVVARGATAKQASVVFDNVRAAAALDGHGDPSARADLRRYRAMQAAVPAGERLAVMLDDPARLDYRRNPIANLDIPGFASPGDQLPMFRGAEPLRAYLIAQGYHYAAFVRSERSRYCFRRDHWIDRIFVDGELFSIMDAYYIDAIESFAELATTTRVLHDADGLVVLDLADVVRAATTRPAAGSELERRSAWVRELADREHLHDAWALSTRANLRFEDGTTSLRFVDDSVDDPRWYEVSHPHEPPRRGQAILPLYRRAHLRVRGTTDMHLLLRAAISFNAVYTHPRLDVSLDGELLASVVADAAGHYAIDATVPRGRLAGGWHDVYLVFSSIGLPDRDVRDLRVARLEAVEWEPR